MSKPERFLQHLKDMGYNSKQIEDFAMFLEPTISRFIENLYETGFTNEELKAMKEVSEAREYDAFETEQYVAFCFNKKTSKDVDQLVADFLDSLVESIESHYKTVAHIVDKLKDEPEEDFVKEFNEYMNELESLYLERIKKEIEDKIQISSKSNE